MKLNITTENLRKALGRIAAVPGVTGAHLPTLGVIIEADGFAAKLRRTTAIASISVTLEANVEEEGVCGIAYETFVNAINAMGAADTELSADAKVLRIKSGKTKGEINAYPADELLPLPEAGEQLGAVAFSTNELLKFLQVTGVAAAKDEKEAQFAGVCIRVVDGQMVLFGVDRRRAHQCYAGPRKEFLYPAEGEKEDLGFMVVNESVAALRKLLPESDSRIDISFHEGCLRAAVADVEALLPVGSKWPPNMGPYIPPKAPAAVTAACNRAELLRAARTAAPMGYLDNRVISVIFHEGDFEAGSIEVVADNQTGAKLGHEIDAEVTGGQNHLRATGQYLCDLVEAMEGENITLNYDEKRRMIYAYTEDRLCMVLLVRDGQAA